MTCKSCKGSGVLTDENGVQFDDVCPRCSGDGTDPGRRSSSMLRAQYRSRHLGVAMTPANELLEHAHRAIAQRRAAKVELMAQLLFMCEIPSSDLNPKRDFEWLELRNAAETLTNTDHGVPSQTSRLMILTRLRELEFRKGRMKPMSSEMVQERRAI